MSLKRLLKIAMNFAAQALAATVLWSAAFASKTPIRGGSRLGASSDGAAPTEDRLVELAHAITVLHYDGIDVADLGRWKKPEPEEQLIGSPLSVGVAGVDVEGLSGPELAFLEDAQFSFHQVNKGGDVQVTMEPGGSRRRRRRLRRRCRHRRLVPPQPALDLLAHQLRHALPHERFVGASVVDDSSPLIVAREDKLQHVLATSGFDAFAGVTDADIHVGSGVVAAFAASSAAVVASS
jgi:hypothetical protein